MAPPEPHRTPDLDAAWFAATLDSGAFDAGHTLWPPDEGLFDPVAEPTLAVDHDATTVPPAFPRAAEGAAWVPTLPRLTWSEGGHDGEPLAETADAGADLTLVRLLGEGGMGRVHLARQRSLRRAVALKTVKPEADRPAARAGLWREALVMARLDHPNVVPVHVLGVDGRDALDNHLEILTRVADAVEFAHAHAVLHRDIKPDNVLVGSFGEVYLADWGVALDLPAAAGPLAVAGLIAVHRLVLWWTGQGDVARALATDAAMLGALGIGQPQMGWPAWFGGTYAFLVALAILAWPAHALELFVSVTLVYPLLFVARGLPGWLASR